VAVLESALVARGWLKTKNFSKKKTQKTRRQELGEGRILAWFCCARQVLYFNFGFRLF
jgi:hypothetical protein